MAQKKRKHQKENPNSIEPSQKRVKTGTDGGAEAPPPRTFAKGGKKAKSAPPKILTKKQLFADREPFPEQQDRDIEAPLYEYLGSEDPAERLEAADTIISKLLDGDGVSESQLDRHLEKRLFRGLASSRKASRLGFSVVLTEILQQLWGKKNLCGDRYRGLTFDFVLNTLMEKTKPSGNIAGQEEKDHYFGQLFGIECFVRAKVLFGDVSRWNTILDLLLKLAKKKVWLKPQCAWVIIQAVPQMDEEVAEATIQKLADAGWSKTTEAVAVAVVFSERFPKMKLPSKAWRDPLASKSLQDLPAILKDGGKQESNGVETTEKQSQSNWTAQLHFVWDIILSRYIRLATINEHNASEQFAQFWRRVVDQTFFSKTATDPQKFTGFMILQRFLEGIASHIFLIKILFSQNLMACLMNQASQGNRYLHRAATKALKAIENAVHARPNVIPEVISELLGKHGAFNFDQRTNSKTIDRTLQFMKPNEVSAVIRTLKRLVLHTADGDSAEKHLLVYCDYLFRLATPGSFEDGSKRSGNDSAAGIALKEFAKVAYPTAGQASSGLTDKTAPILRQKLNSAFAKFVKRPEDFKDFCSAIMSLDSSSVDMDDMLKAELGDALGTLWKLTNPKKTKEDKDASIQGLALLYAVAILQLFNEEPDAIEVLNDLNQCYEKLTRKEKEKNVDVSEQLVEILLAMVARPSSLMRQASERVFEEFTGFMTPEALTLLTDTLAAEESAKGLQSLFDTEADMEDAEEADGDEDHDAKSEIDSDVEFVDVEDADEDEDDDDEAASEDSKDEESDKAEDEDASGDEKNLQELDDALAKILNSHTLDKDKDAESSEDSDMSDSEMMELDTQIGAAFKMQMKGAGKKKEHRNARETVVRFKHRVLDLLAIYARKEAASPAVFGLLRPLLALMGATRTKDLAKKAGDIIASLAQAQRRARANNSGVPSAAAGDVDAEAQLALLGEIHGELAGAETHALAKAASTAGLLVVTSVLAKERIFPRIWDMYGDLMQKWAGRKSVFQLSIMSDFVEWCQSHPSLVAKAAEE